MGIFKSKKQPEAEAGAAQLPPEMPDFIRELYGPRGPAHLLAYISDPGGGEPVRISWMAVPSWDDGEVVADSVNAAAPPGCHARIADWDVAMPNDLYLHVADLFTSGVCDEGGVSPNGDLARIGIAIGNTWARWNLNYQPPPVPDASDDRIWLTP